ncbi:hypothetical protein BC835DRAFT_396880 [Cytidiella melzeri]|nr:hypothetical protein BC835DRAFT_396880 [Cytidiella melzeri]
MPTARIDDEGTTLYYEDSGAPQGSSDYTTVILNHGYVAHAPIFRPMFPHAASHNLRLIAFNQREYPGSSQLSDAQLSLFHSSDEKEQEVVIVDLSRDLARFTAYIISHEKTPAPANTAGKKSGGVCIYSWSGGNASLYGMLTYLPSFEQSVRKILESHVTSIITFGKNQPYDCPETPVTQPFALKDPPSLFLGLQDPPKTYTPARDLKTPPDQLTTAFLVWASTWFKSYPDLDSVTLSSIVDQERLTDDPNDPRYLSSYEAMTQQQKDETLFPGIAARLGPAFVSWKIYVENLRRAIFDTKGTLKGVPLYHLWGAMSPWNCPWSARRLQDMLDEPVVAGEQRREVHIERLEGIHHFVSFPSLIRIFRS